MHDFPVPDTWLAHRVSYGETDSMKVLYHAEYLHIFERSRSRYIREHGMSYAEVERRGIFLPVREIHCRYRRPARYDDLVWARTGIQEWGRASLRFVYELYNEDKTIVLASGMTQHAVLGTEGKPVAAPEWFRKLLGAPARG